MTSPNDPAFIVFCDESGDPGLKDKASDWFIVSAVVVRLANEPKVPQWIRRIKKPMRSQRKAELHFHRLDPKMRFRASRMLGKLPVRCFTVLSHKHNMIGYSNPRVERRHAWRSYAADGKTWTAAPRKSFFHNWLLKVLLERVTVYCGDRCTREFGSPQPIAIQIAKRGGFSLPEFKAYLVDSRIKSTAGTTLLPGDLDWRVVDLDRITEAPAANVAGLQLADIVSGAFGNAVDFRRFGTCETKYARNLAPRMTRSRLNRVTDFGVMAWPRPLRKAGLRPDQLEIFRYYGYSQDWLVGPGPRSAGR
jgi:hypothetical protein